MRWRYKINIVCSACLQFQKNTGKSFRRDFDSFPSAADRFILTECTVKAASGKKHRARTACTGKTRFFPKMQRCAGSNHFTAHTAMSRFAGQPVNVTGTRTKMAIGKSFYGVRIMSHLNSPSIWMQLLRFENRISFDYSMWPIAQMVLQDALGEKMTAKSFNA